MRVEKFSYGALTIGGFKINVHMKKSVKPNLHYMSNETSLTWLVYKLLHAQQKCKFRALINKYSKMPSNKISKRIKNAWTEDDMQSALALVNSTTRSIRSIAKEVRFLIYKFKEVQKVQQYVQKS